MSRQHSLAVAAVAALGLAAAGGAHASAFQNGGFELGTYTPDGNGAQNVVNGTLPGWNLIGVGDVDRNSAGAFGIAGDQGSYFLDLTGYCDLSCPPGGWGGVAQTFDTVNGAKYSVTFDLGASPRYDSAGAGVLVTAGAESASFLNADESVQTGTWHQKTFTFTATGASTTLSFVGNQGQSYVGLDNVTVAETAGPAVGVPEPASWALMIIGFGGAGAALRRRRNGFATA